MSASSIAVPLHRAPLRLRLTDPPGSSTLDGGWWPQSRSLLIELADLVDGFPSDGRIVRAHFSRPDWDDAPARVPVRHGYVQTGSTAYDDTHVIELRTSDRRVLCLLVIPPTMTDAQGEEALHGAVTRGYAASPKALLEAVASR